jgi:hypothetical protein
MSVPVFIHVMSNGDLYVGNNASFAPSDGSATIVTTYKINSDAANQKLGTLSGTIGSSLAATGGTGATGSRQTVKEIS